MQTKSDIAKNHPLTRNGTVRGPGKYEGEPWYVVALWEASLDGDHDREDHNGESMMISFALEGDLREIVGMEDADPREFITLYERSDGFVCHSFTFAEDLDALEGSPE